MRLRVWTVAGFDTLRFLAGSYTEPEDMRLPLRDAECRQCHAVIAKTRDPAGGSSSAPAGTGEGGPETLLETLGAPPPAAPGFHGMREHDTLNVRCVRCHAAHVTADGSVGHFLAASVIEPVCRECHPGM
jgi:hypothetical protein